MMFLTVLMALVFGTIEPQTLQTYDPNRVEDVRISNNRRIPQDTIKYQLQTKAGDRFNPEIIRADVKRLYAQGHFDDIRVDEEVGKTGRWELIEDATFLGSDAPRPLGVPTPAPSGR